MSEYIRVNINFLPENQTHMSVYNEIMEAKKNKIQPTEFLINTVLELRKYKAEKQQLEERQKRYAVYGISECTDWWSDRAAIGSDSI